MKLVTANRELQIADHRLVINATQFYEPCLNVHHEVTIPCEGALGCLKVLSCLCLRA